MPGFPPGFRSAPACPTAAPVIGGIDHTIGGKAGGNFRQPVPLQRHAVDPAHDLGSLRLYDPKAGIVWVFDVTVGRRRKRNACISFHLVHDPALLGNVFRIILVSQPRIKNDGLCFDISDKIVVDVNIAFLVIVHGIAFADLNFLNQAHQRGTV